MSEKPYQWNPDVTDEQSEQILSLFYAGGDNSNKAISQKTGVTAIKVNKLILNHLERVEERINQKVNERHEKEEQRRQWRAEQDQRILDLVESALSEQDGAGSAEDQGDQS